MVYDQFILLYLVMLFLQTIHIFEEIAFKAYDAIGSLNKYLVVASLLVFLSYLPLILITQRIKVGYYLGFFARFLLLEMASFITQGLLKQNPSVAQLGQAYSVESLWVSPVCWYFSSYFRTFSL